MFELKNGDALEVLKTLPDSSIHCCVTSPPYWGLRDYGHDRQIGLESTPEAYVARMVEVFREVRRVLRDDGTCWVNLGDSYASSPSSGGAQSSVLTGGEHKRTPRMPYHRPKALKPKDLVGTPWRVAFALQADGWYLRQDIIWHKPNPMPESVRDRCTKAHEYVFLLTKSPRYYYDADAVSEASVQPERAGKLERSFSTGKPEVVLRQDVGRSVMRTATRNRRSVWTITPKPYKGAHFAVMPPDLVEPCIKAGCPVGGTVLDPFAGSGTTLAVATTLGRNSIGIELNAEYIELAQARIEHAAKTMPLFTGQA